MFNSIYNSFIELKNVYAQYGFKNGNKIIYNTLTEYITFKLSQKFVETHPGKKGYYIITYPFMMKWYKIIIKKRIGPTTLLSINDEFENNVTENIKPFLGPGHDFQGMSISPKDIGYSTLTFNYINGESKTFKENEIMFVTFLN